MVSLLKIVGARQMEEPEDELETRLEHIFAKQEKTHKLEEVEPGEHGVVGECRDDAAQAEHLRVELELGAEGPPRDLNRVLHLGLEIAVLSLDRGEEEPLEKTYHQLLLFAFSDPIRAEQCVGSQDACIDLSL